MDEISSQMPDNDQPIYGLVWGKMVILSPGGDKPEDYTYTPIDPVPDHTVGE